MRVHSQRIRELWKRLSPRAKAKIQDVANREAYSLSKVIYEFPSLVPLKLTSLAASCFSGESEDEWDERRRNDLPRFK